MQVYGNYSTMEANIDEVSADMKQRLEFLSDLRRLEEGQAELAREINILQLPPTRTYTRADMIPVLQAEGEIQEAEMAEHRRQHRLDQQFLELAKILSGAYIDK